jgi:hypothetical protein
VPIDEDPDNVSGRRGCAPAPTDDALVSANKGSARAASNAEWPIVVPSGLPPVEPAFSAWGSEEAPFVVGRPEVLGVSSWSMSTWMKTSGDKGENQTNVIKMMKNMQRRARNMIKQLCSFRDSQNKRKKTPTEAKT